MLALEASTEARMSAAWYISSSLRLLSSPCTEWWHGQLVFGMTASPFA